jgi:hypothetical protein
MCRRIFAANGMPKSVVTDNAWQFVENGVANFAHDWNFKHVTSSPYYQQANGRAELAVKIVNNMIKKSNMSNECGWKALLMYRNTSNNNGSSPALMMRQTRNLLSLSLSKLRITPATIVGQAIQAQNTIRIKTRKTCQTYGLAMKSISSIDQTSSIMWKNTRQSLSYHPGHMK